MHLRACGAVRLDAGVQTLAALFWVYTPAVQLALELLQTLLQGGQSVSGQGQPASLTRVCWPDSYIRSASCSRLLWPPPLEHH